MFVNWKCFILACRSSLYLNSVHFQPKSPIFEKIALHFGVNVAWYACSAIQNRKSSFFWKPFCQFEGDILDVFCKKIQRCRRFAILFSNMSLKMAQFLHWKSKETPRFYPATEGWDQKKFVTAQRQRENRIISYTLPFLSILTVLRQKRRKRTKHFQFLKRRLECFKSNFWDVTKIFSIINLTKQTSRSRFTD